jgi:hypothetical protein
MAIFTVLGAAGIITSATLVSVGSVVTSMIYQRMRQKQMQAEMAAELDKQKGFEIAVDGDTFDLKVVYGKAKIAGGKTHYRVRSDYTGWDYPPASATDIREPETGSLWVDGDTYFSVTKVEYTDLLDPDVRPQDLTFLDTLTVEDFSTPTYIAKVLWEGQRKTLSSELPDLGDSGSFPYSFLRTEREAQGYSSISWNGSNWVVLGTDGALYTSDTWVSSVTEENVQIGETEGGEGIASTAIAHYANVTTTVYRVSRSKSTSYQYFFDDNLTNTGIDGDDREFLFLQQAICYGGISEIVDVEVNEKPWDKKEYKFGQRIHVYLDGNAADPMATANLIGAENNVFTNTAYASCAFRLNREDYNYASGVPNVSFYVKGLKVFGILESGGEYSLSESKTYSNNPALCLLDYLISPTYGLGVGLSNIDLKSFYDSAATCGAIEMTDQAIGGKVNGVRPSKEGDTEETALMDVSRNACNLVLDSGDTVRSNIERLLETMTNAELVWSSGSYKLITPYPKTSVEEDALIVDTFENADIIRNEVSVTWPSTQDRYNQVTVRFRNESENFGEDSVTWPPNYSEVHDQYLSEDASRPSTFEYFAAGITDKYRALTRAEQITRSSRRSAVVKLTVVPRGMLLEPGDLIRIRDTVTGFHDATNFPAGETFKVESVKVNEDLTVALQVVAFSHHDLAWNVDDDIGYSLLLDYTYEVGAPSSVTFSGGAASLLGTTSGVLSWTAPSDIYAFEYQVEVKPTSATEWQALGTTRATQFSVQGLSPGTYNFGVRTRTGTGRLSERTLAEDDLTSNTAITVVSAIEGATLVGGVTASDLSTPAVLINSQSVEVLPDKILIDGVTSLDDWRSPADLSTINGEAIAPESILTTKLTIGDPSNIVPNPGMLNSGEGWSGAGVITAVGSEWPTGFALRLTGVGTSELVGYSPVMKVQPLEVLWAQYYGLAAGTAANDCEAIVQFSAGATFTTILSTAQVSTDPVLGGTGVQSRSGTFTVPADAKYARFQLVKSDNGTTDCYLGSFVLRRAASADLVDTASFATAGLALFGGTLQSIDFDSGVLGWQIDSLGSAEFNDLIVRNSLQDGAVSDFQNFYESASNTTDPDDTHLTFADMPQDGMTVWNFALACEGKTNDSIAAKITVQARLKVDGVWGPYEDATTKDVSSTSFAPVSLHGVFGGVGTEISFRIRNTAVSQGALVTRELTWKLQAVIK